MKNRYKKIVFIVFLPVVILIALFAIYKASHFSLRNNRGEEYKKVWECKDEGISFTSYDELFPKINFEYDATISTKAVQNIRVMNTDDNHLCFGIYDEPVTYYVDGDQNNVDCYADFHECFCGEAIFHNNSIDLHIISANDEFKYLIGKDIVFNLKQ